MEFPLVSQPNIVFGFILYLIFLLNPDMLIWGTIGAFNIASGAGDYLNVFNAITQMPKGARTYLHHFSSYWFMPENKQRKSSCKKHPPVL